MTIAFAIMRANGPDCAARAPQRGAGGARRCGAAARREDAPSRRGCRRREAGAAATLGDGATSGASVCASARVQRLGTGGRLLCCRYKTSEARTTTHDGDFSIQRNSAVNEKNSGDPECTTQGRALLGMTRQRRRAGKPRAVWRQPVTRPPLPALCVRAALREAPPSRGARDAARRGLGQHLAPRVERGWRRADARRALTGAAHGSRDAARAQRVA